jgi:hypothetical protein
MNARRAVLLAAALDVVTATTRWLLWWQAAPGPVAVQLAKGVPPDRLPDDAP